MGTSYRDRIKKPVDIIKQPWLDFQRLIAQVICKLVCSRVKKRARPERIEKVLFIRRNRLGDAVNTLPALQALKLSCPDIEIHVLANKYNSIIYDNSPVVSKVYVIDEKWFLSKLTFFMNPVFKSVQSEKYDMVVGLGGYSSALAQLVLWSKGKYSVGPVSKKDTFYNLFFDQGVKPIEGKDQHHTEDMAALVRAAGFNLSKKLPFPEIKGSETVDNGVIAICPDVNRKQSEYSIENFEILIRQLSQLEFIKKICLFLESEDSKYRKLEKEGVTWVKTDSVKSFIIELSKCQYAISTEGGSAHIASALGLYLVTISGMDHKTYWQPFGKNTSIIERHNNVNDIMPEEIIKQMCLIKDEAI